MLSNYTIELGCPIGNRKTSNKKADPKARFSKSNYEVVKLLLSSWRQNHNHLATLGLRLSLNF